MRAWVIVGAIVLGGMVTACKKREAPSATQSAPPQLPEAEVQRGKNACADYVAKVCACTAAPAAQACELAKALPEAIEVGMGTATSPESSRLDVLQANDVMRKTFKECIERLASLPSLGC